MSPKKTPRAISRGLKCCSLHKRTGPAQQRCWSRGPSAAATLHRTRKTVSGQTKPGRPGQHSQASAAGRRSYPGLVQGSAASPGLGCRAAGRARLGGAGPRGDEMAAAAGRPRLRSGPRPRPGPRRLGPEKAQRALPGVHHGPARGTGSTPRPPLPGEARKAGPPAGRGRRSLAGPARVASLGRRPDRLERSRRQRRREEAGSGRRERGCRPATQTLRPLSRPQREPSGAAMSAPFSLVPSQAPCVRSLAPQGRQGRFWTRPLRGAARTRSPSLSAGPAPT